MIQKGEKLRTSFDQRYLHPQCGEDTGVLTADHPATDDQHRLGNPLQRENLIGVIDTALIEVIERRTKGTASGSDQDNITGQYCPSIPDSDIVFIDKPGRSLIQVDFVLGEIVEDALAFVPFDRPF